MTYNQLLDELNLYAEEQFAEGESRIINDQKLKFLGVRTPTLRKLTRLYKNEEAIFAFPDEYYEVVFLKLAIASEYSFDKFILRVDELVPLVTDWALCDSALKPKCIKKHKAEFVPYIKKCISKEGEFEQRFALIMLLSFYVEEEWLPLIKECVECCDSTKYYAMMGAAWLVSEVLIKHYNYGLAILKSTMCDIKVKNKAISKACDSYRITKEQKIYLKTLRVNFAAQNGKKH